MGIDNRDETVGLFPPGTTAETLTFGDLLAHTKKELVCVASDVCDGTVVYIEPGGFGDMPVWKGVVASMSIPVIFAPCRSDQRLLVDGALLCNLPLDYFPLDESLVFWLAGPGADDPLVSATPDEVLGVGFPSYVRRLLDCSMRFRDRRLVEALRPGNRLIRVGSGGLGATHFTLSRRQQLNAIIAGMVSTMRGVWAFRMAS
jgi:predicted acylesterase/phospholipase RssA